MDGELTPEGERLAAALAEHGSIDHPDVRALLQELVDTSTVRVTIHPDGTIEATS